MSSQKDYKVKCLMCCHDKSKKGFLRGVCLDCQLMIIKEHNAEHDKWCSEETARLQEVRDSIKKARQDLHNSRIGLAIVELIKDIK